jgi:uncharacterized protein YxjI
MNFPLQLSFKILAFAPQIYVRDGSGALVFYVKQKLFKLKEAINVFADEAQTRQVARINADRIIDWNARYAIAGENAQLLGGIGRKGFRSLWAAHYELSGADGSLAGNIREENPFVKIVDGLLSEIPVLGIFSGYFFHPSYVLTAADGTPLLRLKKVPAFLEGRFQIEQLTATSAEEAERNVLAFLMMVLLERKRG